VSDNGLDAVLVSRRSPGRPSRRGRSRYQRPCGGRSTRVVPTTRSSDRSLSCSSMEALPAFASSMQRGTLSCGPYLGVRGIRPRVVCRTRAEGAGEHDLHRCRTDRRTHRGRDLLEGSGDRGGTRGAPGRRGLRHQPHARIAATTSRVCIVPAGQSRNGSTATPFTRNWRSLAGPPRRSTASRPLRSTSACAPGHLRSNSRASGVRRAISIS